MVKKSLYVVTKTIVGRVSLTTDTYVLGYSNSREEAINLLLSEYEKTYELEYDPSKFVHNEIGWTYKSDFIITSVEIHVAIAI